MSLPETRIEHYLHYMAFGGEMPNYPQVTRTRIENYLDYIARNIHGMQFEEMPTPSAKYYRAIVQYVGDTDSNYTRGYFYDCTRSGSATATVTFSKDKISCPNDKFLQFIQGICPLEYDKISKGSMTYVENAGLLVFNGKNTDDETVIVYQQYIEDYENDGFVFTGTFEDDEEVLFTCSIDDSYTYSWEQINVQPA